MRAICQYIHQFYHTNHPILLLSRDLKYYVNPETRREKISLSFNNVNFMVNIYPTRQNIGTNKFPIEMHKKFSR